MKSIKDIKLVVFDMAGTTVTDNHEVELCFTLAAQKTGLKMTDEEILAVQGWSKIQVFETFWERQTGQRNQQWKNQVEHSYAVFREILEDHYHSNEIIPTRGCLELFSFLREHNIAIALTTGFYRKVADIILGKLSWKAGGIIDFSVTSDEVPHGRPEPDMIRKAMQTLQVSDRKSVINIGDTPSDIQSGRNAGVLYSCCVTNGTHSAAQLMPLNPDLAFASLQDMKIWLEKTYKALVKN